MLLSQKKNVKKGSKLEGTKELITERAPELLDGGGLGALGDEAGFGGGRDGGGADGAWAVGDPVAFNGRGRERGRAQAHRRIRVERH